MKKKRGQWRWPMISWWLRWLEVESGGEEDDGVVVSDRKREGGTGGGR